MSRCKYDIVYSDGNGSEWYIKFWNDSSVFIFKDMPNGAMTTSQKLVNDRIEWDVDWIGDWWNKEERDLVDRLISMSLFI